jgi:hypothetical protein
MNTDQIAAAMKLIRLMDADKAARADANQYGRWYEHLTDHILDIRLESELETIKKLESVRQAMASPA